MRDDLCDLRDGLCAWCYKPTTPAPLDQVDDLGIGYCVMCGYFYARIGGGRILDITVKCRIHNPIQPGCPHSGSLRQDV